MVLDFENPCELCSPITRKRDPCPTCRSKTQQRGMPSGFGQQMSALFPQSREEPDPPYIPKSAFGMQMEASQHGGAQNTIRSTNVAEKENPINRNFGRGFRGQYEAALGSSEEKSRMLEKDNSYITSKPQSSHLGMQKGTEDKAFIAKKLKEMENRILNSVSKLLNELSRSTAPVQRSTERRFTMRGFEEYEIIDNPDGTQSLHRVINPSPEQPRPPDEIPEALIALEYHHMEAEKRRIQRAIDARNNPVIDTRYGLKAMISEAFR